MIKEKGEDMKNDMNELRRLIGNDLSEDDLKNMDCFVKDPFGLFIPINEAGGYVSMKQHMHPSYTVFISFDQISSKRNHYVATIISPFVKYKEHSKINYYTICIGKEWFESHYIMYEPDIPVFEEYRFEMCDDILKYLNMFAFEHSKSMMHSDVTMQAHIELITHWIIRSILGESMDMRAVSSDYAIARAQHFMEQHYSEKITVASLANLSYTSPSTLTHKFKTELGVTPIEYLIEIRIEKSKLLLKRANISLTEIAMECGFSSLSHYSSCFQKRVGMSPTEYQRRYIGY